MTVRVWDPSSGKEVRSLKGHSGRVLGVAFGADSRQLASCGEDSAVILWETGTSRIAKRLKDPGGAVRSVCFSPDGSQLVSGGDNSLRLWDVQKRELIKVLSERPQRGRAVDTISFNESIMVSSFSPDGAVLACGCTNNTVVVWDAKTWDRRILRPAR
jgi:WD40 repeat protein